MTVQPTNAYKWLIIEDIQGNGSYETGKSDTNDSGHNNDNNDITCKYKQQLQWTIIMEILE